ncbi:MAG: DnaD domain protein [Christensenellaceae bacterium]
MSFCSFSKEFGAAQTTTIQNSFITDYLSDVNGDAVKIYIYGLYLCENSSVDVNITAFSEALYLDEETVKDYFRFWEEYGVLTIISHEPFTVKYLNLAKTGKPRKIKPEKYSDFTKAVQSIITRMIPPNEYAEYFAIMEDYFIKPEAMLMIIKYCVDLKGPNIGGKYILTVARDFAFRQITTIEAIENELSDYNMRTSDILEIFKAAGIKKKPDIDDLKFFKKWHNEMQFEVSAIAFVARKLKIHTMEKLNSTMNELYANKAFCAKEIENYLNEKEQLKATTMKIATNLSVYCEIITPYIDNYVSPWKSKGFSDETLLFISNYCFKKKKKSFEDMNETVNNLYENGLVTLESIVSYTKTLSKNDEFIKTLLDYAQIVRRPTKWDRDNLNLWRNWGFSDEMLVEAAKLSSGKNNPVSYMNIVLSNWKAGGIFTKDKIPSNSEPGPTASKRTAETFGNEREYNKEFFDDFFNNIDEIDF